MQQRLLSDLTYMELKLLRLLEVAVEVVFLSDLTYMELKLPLEPFPSIVDSPLSDLTYMELKLGALTQKEY